jgi:hypothetical protein
MADNTSYCLRWSRTRSGIVIAPKRYPANRVRRGTYKVCDGVFKYQHQAGREAIPGATTESLAQRESLKWKNWKWFKLSYGSSFAVAAS